MCGCVSDYVFPHLENLFGHVSALVSFPVNPDGRVGFPHGHVDDFRDFLGNPENSQGRVSAPVAFLVPL